MKLKAVSIILALTLILAALAACGGTSYRNDVAIGDLSSSMELAAGLGSAMIEAPASYVSGTMKLDTSALSGYSVRMNSAGVNIDEFGVFQCQNASQAKEVEAALKAYLQFRLDSWMVEYMPREYPKLQNAQIKVMGNYLAYAILSDAQASSALGAMETALKK